MSKSIKYVAGIDPGKTGAVAVLDSKDMAVVDMRDFGDPGEIAEFLKTYPLDMAVLEKVGAMPKQGVVSVFSFGTNYGLWQGLLTALKVPFSLVTPQLWMKGQVLPSDHADRKKRGLTVCRRLYPESKYFKREKDHNRADAVLIARYAILKGLV